MAIFARTGPSGFELASAAASVSVDFVLVIALFTVLSLHIAVSTKLEIYRRRIVHVPAVEMVWTDPAGLDFAESRAAVSECSVSIIALLEVFGIPKAVPTFLDHYFRRAGRRLPIDIRTGPVFLDLTATAARLQPVVTLLRRRLVNFVPANRRLNFGAF